MSEDAPAAAPPPVAEETVSKESYDALKAQLEQKSQDLAEARARGEVYENKERTRIAAFQPAAKEFMNEMLAEADAETKADLQPLATWADEFAAKQDILSQAPLARLVSCASAKLKRTRDEASMNSESVAALSGAMAELESTKTERDGLRVRVGELETLANERQAGLEKLQAELARAGLLSEKFDFSKISSREKGVEPTAAAGSSKEQAAVGSTTLEAVTSNASKTPVAVQDKLFAEIMSRGGGNLRVIGSGTSHALLGGSSTDGDLMAALRVK